MWLRAATLNRVRWHGALLEQHVAKHRGKALGFMVVQSTAAPPQGAARVESNAVVRRIGAQMPASVTAVLGDTVHLQVVRSIMRGMFLLSGNVKRHLVVSSEAEAIDWILAQAESPAPSRAELAAVVRALHAALAAEPAPEQVGNPALD